MHILMLYIYCNIFVTEIIKKKTFIIYYFFIAQCALHQPPWYRFLQQLMLGHLMKKCLVCTESKSTLLFLIRVRFFELPESSSDPYILSEVNFNIILLSIPNISCLCGFSKNVLSNYIFLFQILLTCKLQIQHLVKDEIL